jgi:lysophospholipase L1-like esterase
MTRLTRLCALSGLAFISVALAFGLLSIFDHILAKRALGYLELWQDSPTLSTLDFYPYTGHHIQAHFHQVGPDVRDAQNLNVQSGDHGFFIDFPIDHPPSKTAKEFRLILIGGSAAQGFGARTNDDMFYRRLEVKVNALLASRQKDARLRVINFAMASAISYQNFLALNMWAHPMEPDAIVSFAGVNELSTYRIFQSNLYNHAASYGGFSLSQRHWESQGWQQLLANFFPGVFKYSNVAQALRVLALPQRTRQFISGYASRFPTEDIRVAAARFQSHALLSILRDFADIPLLYVTQPLRDADESYDATQALMIDMLKNSPHSGRIAYINAHAYWKENAYFLGSLPDSVHLSNEGQDRIAEYLMEPVAQMVIDHFP